MGTDEAWEEWGRRDPYFGVLTKPKYRRAVMDEKARREFLESGRDYVAHVMRCIHGHIDGRFAPRRVLEFGCGVGRLLVHFAGVAEQVVGVDVSASMLEEARRNCEERALGNVQLLRTDDELSSLEGSFDLIHSVLVFQHIPVERGRAIFARLLRFLKPGGVGAIQLTYAKSRFAAAHGVAPQRPPAPPQSLPTEVPAPPADADPEIQMNPYNLNEILFLLQCQGTQRTYTEFGDLGGGELGVTLYFDVTAPPLPLPEPAPPAAPAAGERQC